MRKKITLFAWLFTLVCMQSFAQDRTLTGKVTSSTDNTGIPGVSVVVVGTTIGTTTDIDGNYKLTVPATAKQLKFSGVGLKSKTSDIGAADAMDMSMANDVMKLDEVVVTALGISKEKKSLGYAVQDVTSDELTRGGNINAIGALSGKVAGLQITTASGMPGAATNIRLRGATSIIGNNQPLLVVDGLPIDNSQNSTLDNTQGFLYGPINGDVNANRGVDLNSDDIESITVLKGAAATALYGIQAANGALIVTTKRGSKTIGAGKKFNVTVSSSLQWDQVNKLPEEQTRFTQGSKGSFTPYATRSWGSLADTMYWDGVPVDNMDSHGSLVGQSDPTAKTKFSAYDNENNFLQTGKTWNKSVSFTGGDDKNTFRASFGNVRQTGIIPNSKYDKTNVSIAGDSKLNSKLAVGGIANYVNSTQDGNLSGNNTSAITYGIYRTPINFDNSNGINSTTDPKMYVAADGHQRSYTYYLGVDNGDNLSYFDNPYWTINRNPYSSNLSRVFGNAYFNYNATSWLNVLYRLGGDTYSDRHKQVYDKESASVPEGQDIEDQYFNRVVNSDLIITANRKLYKDLNGQLLLGQNTYSNYSQNLYTIGDALNFGEFYNLSNAQTIISKEATTKKRTAAIYGVINLDWRSMLYLSLTGRNEWSSTLPEDKNSFFYPSASLGFVFTEALKMSENKILPYGKLRFNYAIVGNDASPYSLRNVYSQQLVIDGWTNGVQFPFNGSGGFMLSPTLANSGIKPEKTTSTEVGADLRFLKNRIGLDLTYYYSKTEDEILTVPIAPSSGYSGGIFNAGSIENKGFEAILNLGVVESKKFTWDISFNYAMNRSKVLSLSNGLTDVLIGGFDGASVHAIVGQPYGVIKAGHFYRTPSGQVVVDDQTTLANGDPNPNYGFPLIASSDTIVGNPNPDWIGGIRNTFSYKGFSLSILFDIKMGGDMHDGTRSALVTYGRAAETDDRASHDFYFEGVKGHVDGDGNTVVDGGTNDIHINGSKDVTGTGTPAYQYWWAGNGGGFGKANEIFIEDAGYTKLREISLSYSFDKKCFAKTFIGGIDISVMGRNLYTWTKYKGVDPDQSIAGASNTQGLEWFNLPNTRSYGFTVKVHF